MAYSRHSEPFVPCGRHQGAGAHRHHGQGRALRIQHARLRYGTPARGPRVPHAEAIQGRFTHPQRGVPGALEIASPFLVTNAMDAKATKRGVLAIAAVAYRGRIKTSVDRLTLSTLPFGLG